MVKVAENEGMALREVYSLELERFFLDGMDADSCDLFISACQCGRTSRNATMSLEKIDDVSKVFESGIAKNYTC
jgi:hypothetical protein